MSNALAVAHVTQALALLIESNLRPEIDMAVSVETRKPPPDPPAEPTITVFLYQVTHNPSMRNYDLPARASDGTLLNRPVAALDLHYVISAYGEENELVGQRLIGCVARILREFPVLPADVIEEAGERPYLAGSDLAASEQKVRFTPTQMDVDETSKLWGMLHQTPYSLSMVYQGSLVLVEGREKPEPARPVERTDIRVGAPGPQPAGTPRPGAAAAPGVAVAAGGAGEPEGRTGDSGSAGRSGSGEETEEPVPGQVPGGSTAAKKPSGRKAPAKKAAGKRADSGRSAASRKRPRRGGPDAAAGDASAEGKES